MSLATSLVWVYLIGALTLAVLLLTGELYAAFVPLSLTIK